jgi:hypothetical protein
MRGSGRRFEFPNSIDWRVAAFQRSRWNDASTVEFTVNLYRCPRSEWEAERDRLDWLPVRPSGSSVGTGRLLRIGNLLADGHDRWWRIDADVDITEVGRDVAEAIVSLGIPWLVGAERHPAEL